MANVVAPKPSGRSYASITMSTTSTGESEPVSLTGLCLSAIQISSNWTTASMGFKSNCDGSTNFYPVKDSLGSFLTYSCSAAQVLALDPALFAGLGKIVLVSCTTAGVGVAQNAARSLVLGLSPAYM